MDMNINTKISVKLSEDGLNKLLASVKKLKDRTPQALENTIKRLSEEAKEGNYSSTELIPIEKNGNKVRGGIRTTDEGETYAEFGTGVVGIENPHVAEWLTNSGWQYDVNGHGESGWRYQDEDGIWHWTKGQPAQKRFYNASIRVQENFKNVLSEEIDKITKRS